MKRSLTLVWNVLALGALVLVSCSVMAIREEQTFHVSVTIPTNEFYVLPVDPAFLEREQALAWNTVTGELSPLRAFFDVKNASGSVSARLVDDPFLFNGRERIDLQVRFNGHLLSLLDTSVVDEQQARVGQRVRLEIAAVKPAEGYIPGQYYGTAHLMFDAVNP
ncbi:MULTISPECIES: CS1 type fimbrial major subunit [unclassified Pseudomonas]|uniref:CS1 type fimbrial major subunit n=1 Tax=unclassified Pseudomonas TaxID=196821 RepID=UPI002AC8C9D1|nr:MULTISPECIES: CS1 type fimbrial major subunit [unclassified Pseudomonas]MEB0044986.1 CS1 type fimbrial major subunit [Pseudomonas sp. Dout3]MEB0096002.1 CS1 type fimbrial major subunit [Pseudomonas sp. DC1.2]WPX57866.1 CS1 type fimbrial major subunit [Pseudomonas sp. DC1.2]